MKKTSLILFSSVVLSQGLFAFSPPKYRSLIVPLSQERFEFKQRQLENISKQSTEPFSAKSILAVNQNTPVKRKWSAFWRSLILPGWGQHYAESRTMMKVFIASEVLLWGAYIGLETWGNWLEDDYRTFSVEHAGVNLSGKAADYFVDISNFDNIFEFNQQQLRNRDIAALYTDIETFFWQWDSEANRHEYDDLRLRSDRARNRADFALAFIFTNHLVSAIHATLAVFKFNERLQQHGLKLKINYNYKALEYPYLQIGLAKSF